MQIEAQVEGVVRDYWALTWRPPAPLYKLSSTASRRVILLFDDMHSILGLDTPKRFCVKPMRFDALDFNELYFLDFVAAARALLQMGVAAQLRFASCVLAHARIVCDCRFCTSPGWHTPRFKLRVSCRPLSGSRFGGLWVALPRVTTPIGSSARRCRASHD
jgi:hypothetical protein